MLLTYIHAYIYRLDEKIDEVRDETSALRSTNERLRYQLAELTKQNKNLTVTLSNNRKTKLTNINTNRAPTLNNTDTTEAHHTSNHLEEENNDLNINQYNNMSLDQFLSSPSYTNANTDEALDSSYPQESTTLPYMGESSIEGSLTIKPQPQQLHTEEGNIKRFTNASTSYFLVYTVYIYMYV